MVLQQCLVCVVISHTTTSHNTAHCFVFQNGESSNGDDDLRYETPDGRIVLGNNTAEEEAAANKKSEESSAKQSCFNCCGDHQVIFLFRRNENHSNTQLQWGSK